MSKKADKASRWYQKNWAIIALLVLFFPAGLYFAYRSDWSKRAKIIATGVVTAFITLFAIGIVLAPPSIEFSSFNDAETPVVEEDEFTFKGKVFPYDAKLEVNGDVVSTSDTGEFEHSVSLEEGENSIEVKASDGDKVTTKTFNVRRLTAEEIAQRKAEEEARRKAEEEERRKAEAEAERKAEEEAARAAAEAKRLAEEQANETPSYERIETWINKYGTVADVHYLIKENYKPSKKQIQKIVIELRKGRVDCDEEYYGCDYYIWDNMAGYDNRKSTDKPADVVAQANKKHLAGYINTGNVFYYYGQGAPDGKLIYYDEDEHKFISL